MLIKPQDPTMNCSDEKLSVPCDKRKGMSALPEIQLNFDQFLEDLSHKNTKSIGSYNFAVNFLQSQNNNNGWENISKQISNCVQNKTYFFPDENQNSNMLLQPQIQPAEARTLSVPPPGGDPIAAPRPVEKKKKSGNVATKPDGKYTWQTNIGIFCNKCNNTFSDKRIFDKHYRDDHSGHDIMYTCSHCKKDIKFYNKFRNHCYRHLIYARFKCENCPKTFSQQCHLTEHRKTHLENGKPTCNICDKTFDTKPGLSLHNRTHHLEEEFCCWLCGKKVHTATGLDAHLKTHKFGSQYICHICAMRFTQKANLKHHIKLHTSSAEYACSLCPKAFYLKSQLARHMREHLDVDKYKCDICSKAFSNEHTLKNHWLTHANTRKYVCETCGKGFLRPSKLMQHINTHTGEKPYECQYCKRTFSNFPNWHKHIKRVHKVDHKTGVSLDPKENIAVFKVHDNSTQPVRTESANSLQSSTASLECSLSLAASEYYFQTLTPSSEYSIQSLTPSSESSIQAMINAFETSVQSVITTTESSTRAVINETCTNIKENYWSSNDTGSSPNKLYKEVTDISSMDDCESIVSMDSPENSILLYNERLENEDLDFEFSIETPPIHSISDTLESDLQLDQSESLPHNGWQKLNLREVILDPSEKKTYASSVPAEERVNTTDSKMLDPNNVIFTDTNENSLLSDQLNFDLDVDIGTFGIEETDQFETDASLSETLRDQELELSHSYIREQTEGCVQYQPPEGTNFIVPLILSSLDEEKLPDIHNQQESPLLDPYQPQLLEYRHTLDTATSTFGVVESELLHSMKLTASKMNGNKVDMFSTIDQSYEGCHSVANINNNVLTIESNSPTSSVIYNTNDLKNKINPNTYSNTVNVAQSPKHDLDDSQSLPDVNNLISHVLGWNHAEADSVQMNQLSYVDSTGYADSINENLIENCKMLTLNQLNQKTLGAELTMLSEQSADLGMNNSDLSFQVVLNNILDNNANFDNLLNSVEQLHSGPDCAPVLSSDVQLSAYMLTQPLGEERHWPAAVPFPLSAGPH